MSRCTWSERLGISFNYAALTLLGMVTLFPLLHVVAQSLSSQDAIISNRVSVYPVGFQLEAYKKLLQDDAFYRASGIAIARTVVGVLVNMTLTCLMAYSLSRRTLKGRSLVMNLIIFTMLFNGGMIPTFLVLKELRLINTFWSLILPQAVSAFNLVLLKNFFHSIPDSIEESACIDGAGHGTILFRLFLPLSLPAIATLTLFYAVMHWNAYFDAVMYINDSKLIPLQVYLRNIIALDDSGIELTDNLGLFLVSPESLKAATIVASVLPMLVLYPFLQRYFVKGVMLGAVKG
jgi:putative aldouronate transport system permease protein